MPTIQSKWGAWSIGADGESRFNLSSSGSVAALLAGSDLALCAEAAGSDLALPVPGPKEMAAAQVEARGEAERFVISGGIAQVALRGILTKSSGFARYFGWSTYDGLAESLADLGERSDVSAIVLRVDSPGGQIHGIPRAVEALRAVAAKKPLYAVCDGVVASAAYWLASQAQEISLSRGSWVGSVGVLSTAAAPVGPDLWGEQAFIITSRHAGAKRPDPSTEAGRALIQARADALEDEFLADVAQGRGIERGELVKRLSLSGEAANGGDVFWNEDAVARGLVDRIEDPQAALDRISAAHGRKAAPRRGASARAQAAAAAAIASL